MVNIFAASDSLIERPDGSIDIRLSGGNYSHIVRSLRLRPGEEFSVRLTDREDDSEYRFAVTEIDDVSVTGELLFVKPADTELTSRVYLFQGLPKGDKLELIIQKCVELGVYRIAPVAMKRSVVRLDERRAASKRARWASIAKSAAEQSRRALIPEVTEVMSFAQAMDYADSEGMTVRLWPYELAAGGLADTRRLLSDIPEGSRIGLLIGPEGGFDRSEAELAADRGWRAMSLGRRILRTETAGMAVMSWLDYILET